MKRSMRMGVYTLPAYYAPTLNNIFCKEYIKCFNLKFVEFNQMHVLICVVW
jgi:hypothetical protein